MLKQIISKGNLRFCNYCGIEFDLVDAEIHKKGNHFFCSKECVLKYDDSLKNSSISREKT